MVAKLGTHVFAIDGLSEVHGDLVSVIDQMMTAGKHMLAVIETASQGLLAAKCIGLIWLLETRYEQSLVKLAEKLAIQLDADDLMSSAKILAVETQKTSGADIILVQLYAGNEQQFHNKDQAIKLFTALLHGEHFETAMHTVAGPAKRKQNQAALLALDLLRRYLQPSLLI
jgi:hypothetical protein